MDIRTLAFGTRWRSAAVALVAVLGVVGAAVALGWIGVPSVVATQNSFAGVNQTTTTVDTSLTVHNPNPIAVKLGGVSVDYTVSMNDVGLAYGAKRGVAVGTGNTTLRFASYIRNERIPTWWTSHVRNGEETTVTVAANVTSGTVGRTTHVVPVTRSVTTNISNQFNSTADRPIEAGLPLVSDPVLVVDETRAHWGTVTNDSTPLETSFVIHNPKSVPVTIGGIGYDVAMNDVAVGSGQSENTVVIPPGGTRTLRAETVIDTDRIDEWWVTHLQRNQTTRVVIDFYARLSAGNGQAIRVPLRGLTYRQTIETDIFRTKNASATNASASNASATDGSENAATNESGGGLDGLVFDGSTSGTASDDGVLGAFDGRTTESGTTDETTDGTTSGSDGTTSGSDGTTSGGEGTTSTASRTTTATTTSTTDGTTNETTDGATSATSGTSATNETTTDGTATDGLLAVGML